MLTLTIQLHKNNYLHQSDFITQLHQGVVSLLPDNIMQSDFQNAEYSVVIAYTGFR